MFKKLVYITLLLITFNSCEEEIVFENKNFRPKLVMHAIFTNDSIWVVSLAHSTNALLPNVGENFVEDAKIVITKINGEQECKLYHEKDGIYKSFGCTTSSEELFKITVHSDKYGDISAESRIPKTANLSDIKLKQSEQFEDASEIEFKINDNSEASNYYIWSIVEVDSTNYIVGDNVRIDLANWVRDVTRQPTQVSNVKFNSTEAVTESELSQQQGISKFITKKSLNSEGAGNTSSKKVSKLRLMTVSSDLYNYYQSLREYNKQNQTQSSVTDPTKLYSNVKGGFGIFAGYSVSYYEIPK